MKICTKCNIELDENEFHKDNRSITGRQSHCKKCRKSIPNKYYLNNKQLVNERSKNWGKNNPEKIKIITKRYYYKNKERVNIACKEYHINNIYFRNLKSLKWRLDNKENIRKYNRKWTQENKELKNFHNRRRELDKIQRTPKWADLEAIKNFYLNCPVGYHVDHIIPLRGRTVSGFHILENLQYLLAADNLKKSNKI